MAGSVNKVILIGNVGKDPIIRKPIEGNSFASFSLATSESWKDKTTGERKDKTEWHKISVFNDRLVGVIEKYVTKGSRIYVEGSLQTRTWSDTDGTTKYTTEIVISKFKGDIVLLSKNDTSELGHSDNSFAKPDIMLFSDDLPNRSSELPLNFDDIEDTVPF